MEIGGRLIGGLNAHGRRQKIVERLDEVRAGDRGDGVKIGDLMRSVNAGVGSPRSVHLHRGTGQRVDCIFKTRLYGRRRRLPLPAVEVRSIIGESQSNIAHGESDSKQRRVRR